MIRFLGWRGVVGGSGKVKGGTRRITTKTSIICPRGQRAVQVEPVTVLIIDNDDCGPCGLESRKNWTRYLDNAFSEQKCIPHDGGLVEIAKYLSDLEGTHNRTDALAINDDATELECRGMFKEAIAKYNKSYRLWPSLDSVLAGGIPRAVRAEALEGGYPGPLLTDVDTSLARKSKVSVKRELLTSEDIEDLLRMADAIRSEEGIEGNNPENSTHECKHAIMINNDNRLRWELPGVLGKVVKFAEESLERGEWCKEGGPLNAIEGIEGLTVRVAEVWTYEVGGGLVDNYHLDTDSIVTIVCLLSEIVEFEGGKFQTFEVGDTQLDYGMERGDGACLVSHKYHNIERVSRGRRKSLVVEMWEGEGGKKGR